MIQRKEEQNMVLFTSKVFNYQGTEISFKTINGELMVSATQMAKPFGTSAKDFTRTDETKAYIDALNQVANMPLGSISATYWGGDMSGTWFCRLLAVRFAQWLDPKFAIWVDMQILDILTPRTNWFGIPTIVYNSRLVVKFIKVLRYLGKATSGRRYQRIKQCNQVEFEKFDNCNYITVDFADRLKSNMANNQTELDLFPIQDEPKALEGGSNE